VAPSGLYAWLFHAFLVILLRNKLPGQEFHEVSPEGGRELTVERICGTRRFQDGGG